MSESTSGTVYIENRKHKNRVHSSTNIDRDNSLSCDDSDMSRQESKRKD